MVCKKCMQPYWRCTCPGSEEGGYRCTACGGSGTVQSKKGLFRKRSSVCPNCNGTGMSNDNWEMPKFD